MFPLKEFALKNELLVAAHRGSSGTAPENTISSIEEAIRIGAKFIEIDVQLTKDKHPIVYHDFLLSTTKKPINELYYEEIKKYDIGTKFHPDYSGENIPLLDKIIETAKGKAYILLEVKANSNFILDDFLYILNIVKNHNYEEFTIFTSFKFELLKKIKEIDKNLITAALKHYNDQRFPSEIVAELNCEAFFCSIVEINKDISDDAHKNNIILGCYPVDSIEELNYIKQFHVNAVASNFPELILNELLKS